MRPEKIAILDEIRNNVTDSDFVLLVDYDGLTVERMNELRTKLGSVNARMQIVRNSLFKLVAREQGWKQIEDDLAGPTATITGTDDVAAAKALKEFSADDNRPVVKCGMLQQTFVSADEVNRLANLPSREILLGMFVSTVAQPLMGLPRVLNQKLLSLLYVLKAAEEKKAAV